MGKFIDEINADKVISTVLGCSLRDVAPVVILSSADRLREYTLLCEKVIVEFRRWWKGFTGIFNGCRITVIHVGMGCSNVGDLTMFLSRSPCRMAIYTGLIGGIVSTVKQGDLIVPTEAVIGEGFSTLYVDKNSTPKVDLKLVDACKPLLHEFADRLNLDVHLGMVYTIESLAAESTELITQLARSGVIGIDMETSAFFVAATISKLHPLAIHLVSDSPPFSSFGESKDPLLFGRVWKSLPNLVLLLGNTLSKM